MTTLEQSNMEAKLRALYSKKEDNQFNAVQGMPRTIKGNYKGVAGQAGQRDGTFPPNASVVLT